MHKTWVMETQALKVSNKDKAFHSLLVHRVLDLQSPENTLFIDPLLHLNSMILVQDNPSPLFILDSDLSLSLLRQGQFRLHHVPLHLRCLRRPGERTHPAQVERASVRAVLRRAEAVLQITLHRLG